MEVGVCTLVISFVKGLAGMWLLFMITSYDAKASLTTAQNPKGHQREFLQTDRLASISYAICHMLIGQQQQQQHHI